MEIIPSSTVEYKDSKGPVLTKSNYTANKLHYRGLRERLKMELFKVLIAAIITVTLSSQTLCAPIQSTPSTVQILVTYVIPSKTTNATHQIRNLYQFINSTSYLFESPFSRFPSQINTQSCTSNQQLKANLTIAYEKMDIFRSPLYMALSYEENQGPLHKLLAQVLWDISTQVNASSAMLSREMQKNSFPVPNTSTGNSTAQMNQIIRVYLQALVNDNLLQGPLTDDMVNIYRNYVVLYSLSEVINEVAICVYNL